MAMRVSCECRASVVQVLYECCASVMCRYITILDNNMTCQTWAPHSPNHYSRDHIEHTNHFIFLIRAICLGICSYCFERDSLNK